MRSWFVVVAVVMLTSCVAMAGTAAASGTTDITRAPDLLVRVERQTDGDLARLAASGAAVVLETARALFVECTADDAARLAASGWSVRTIDGRPRDFGYWQVGLRPGTDLAAVLAAGVVVHSEENWLLLRVPPDFDVRAIDRAGAFLAPVRHTPLESAAPPPLAPRTPSAAPSPLIQKMVAAVTQTDLDKYWTDLTTNPPSGTRYSTSQGARDAGLYCKGQFEALKLPAALQNYNASYAPNVIATQAGALTPGQVYIVIGHLDDLPSSGTAPGADDNASGSVNVLESAKVMSCWAFKSTVKYIACTGEEQGLVGSDAYAADAKNRGEDIRGVINMDMIAWAGDGSPNPENLDLNYNAASQDLGLLFAQNATDYATGLVVDAFLCPSLTASDHASFWSRGWKAVCGITDNEDYCGHGGNYPYYHTSNDTIANCGDRSLFRGTVKTSVATLATLAEPFKIAFDRATVGCGVTAQLVLGDRDLDTDASTIQTVAVEVWSTSEPDRETFVLTEENADSMIFRGAVPTTTGPAVHGDGRLSIAPGDVLSARYVDARDCDGAAGVTYTATATTDCVAPVISNVHETGVSDVAATVAWTTDESSDGTVIWGQALPPATRTAGAAGVTGHQVPLTGLQACTVYYYAVESADPAGNVTRADNAGAYYHFETQGNFGSGPQPCHQGRVTVSKDTLACSDAFEVRLVDMDVNFSSAVADTVRVELTSSSETLPESVTLVETGANTSTFTATVHVAPGPPVAGDGLVQAGDGDVVTATYRDANDGTQHTALSYDTARVDCGGPAIEPLDVVSITDDGATIRFTTSEPTTGRVDFGPTAALGASASDATLATTHQLAIAPFAECGRGYFRVSATDAYGNTSSLDRQGQPFEFNAGLIPGPWRDGFETTTGWTFTGEWQIGAPAGKGSSPPDPTAAYAGTKVMGEDLTGTGTKPGDYEPKVDERAISPVINASTLTGGQLKFRRWLNVGGGAIAYVEVKQGLVWQSVWNSDSIQGVSDTAWSLQTVNVSAYADHNGSLQFAFRTKAGPSATNSRSGWNLDRVVLHSGAGPDFDACGACGGAPSFGGVLAARDADACANSGTTVSWHAAPAWGTGRAGTYTVYRDSLPNFAPSASNRVAHGVTGTSFDDATAPDGATLYYLVRAENDETCSTGAHNGGVTDANTITVPVATTSAEATPGGIDALAVSRVGGVHVRLLWPVAAGATSYRAYRAANPAPASFVRTGETAGLFWDDLGEGATPATWFYLVRAANRCGSEGP